MITSAPIPCFLEFTEEAVEDRTASIDAGHPVYHNIHFVTITPPGGRDNVKKLAAEWLDSKDGSRDPFAAHYRSTYKAWCEGQEAPVSGTSLKQWPPVTAAELKMLQHAGVRTVEELNVANDATLTRVGMGARALQAKARVWLETAASTGRVTEKHAALEIELAECKKRNAELTELVALLQPRDTLKLKKAMA